MGFVVHAIFLPWQKFQELWWSHGAVVGVGVRSGPEPELALKDFAIRGGNLAYMTPLTPAMTPLFLSRSLSKI